MPETKSKPVFGAAQIQQVLSDYRDAIRYVVSETVKGMNSGLDPVTIANNLKLPDHLIDKPYLKEFYGHVGYASRAYFAGTLGWFDGNPTSLGELHPSAEAVKFIALVGGEEKIMAEAQSSLDRGEPQWAMELVDRLLAVDRKNGAAKQIKIEALKLLADQTINAPTRNYYFLSARELKEDE